MAHGSSGIIDLAESGYYTQKDGCRNYYELHGVGPQKIILLQGLQTSMLTWKHQVEYFVTDPEKRYQVLLFDNRGYGRSDRPAKFSSTRRMAKDVFALLHDQLKWKHYHLVGQSLGGMIAQELALLDTRRLLSLTLAVTHSGGVTSFPPFEGIGKAIGALFASQTGIEDHAAALLSLQYPNEWLQCKYEGTQETNLKYMMAFLMEDLKWGCPNGVPPISGLVSQLSAIARHYVSNHRLTQLKENLASQGTPALLITGSEDLLVRLENSSKLQEILGCPLFAIENTGHMPHIQAPHQFNSILHAHIQKAPAELPSHSHSSSHKSHPIRSKL